MRLSVWPALLYGLTTEAAAEVEAVELEPPPEPEPKPEPLPRLASPAPRPGKLYALGAPFLAVQVVRLSAGWVHIRLKAGADPSIPRKIRRRHWASKDPVELTGDLMAAILERETARKEAAERGVHLAPIDLSAGRGRALLAAISGLA